MNIWLYFLLFCLSVQANPFCSDLFLTEQSFHSDILVKLRSLKEKKFLDERFFLNKQLIFRVLDRSLRHGSPLSSFQELSFLKELMKNYQEILSEGGIATKLVMSRSSATYLLEYQPAQSSGEYAKYLNRIIEKTKVSSVTFNPINNQLNGRLGSFSYGSVELGEAGIVAALRQHDLELVGYHEFSHAQFYNLRDSRRDTIYSAQYLQNDSSKSLASQQNFYSNYVSAEEIYNFANEPFWATQRFSKLKDIGELYSILELVESNFKSMDKLFKYMEEVIQKNIIALEKLSSSKFRKPIKLLDWMGTEASRPEDLASIIIKHDFEYLDSIFSPKIRPLVFDLLELRKKARVLADAEQSALATLQEINNVENKVYKELILRQKTLAQNIAEVSKSLSSIQDQTFKLSDDINKLDFKSEIPAELRLRMQTLRSSYRKFSMPVRKDFVTK